jgi:hypothetical protein
MFEFNTVKNVAARMFARARVLAVPVRPEPFSSIMPYGRLTAEPDMREKE